MMGGYSVEIPISRPWARSARIWKWRSVNSSGSVLKRDIHRGTREELFNHRYVKIKDLCENTDK